MLITVPQSRTNLKARLWRLEVRRQAVAAYGGRCNCCGQTDWMFLTLVWTRQAGAKACTRPSIAESSALWVQGLPRGLVKVVCWACTLAEDLYGECPHRMSSDQRELLDQSPLDVVQAIA